MADPTDDDPPLTRLHVLAGASHGVVTVATALGLGVSRSALRTEREKGIWTSPQRGILVATAAPATWAQESMVAVTAAIGAASHRGAARLHRLDGFGDAPVEVLVQRPHQPRSASAVVHQTTRFDPQDLTIVDGIPTTSIARTLVDLGAVVEDDLVEQALDDALRRGTSRRWIEQTLDRLDRPGPSGTASLRRVLDRPDRRGAVPDSQFERLVERAVTAGGLPRPDRQVAVHDRDGRLIGRLDMAWPDARFGVEAHSGRWHSGARRGRADLRRDQRLLGAGWEVMYVTWSDVEKPQDFVRELSSAYHLRAGGTLTPTPAPG